MNTKERLLIYLKHLGIGQNAFEEKVGIANGYISHNKGSLGSDIIAKISESSPDLDIVWLITGDGEMIKGKTVQKVGSVCSGIGNIGEMHGDYHGDNGGKDRAILEQEKNVQNSRDVLLSELQRFHEQLERKDAYLKEVVSASFHRNDEQNKRMDELIGIIISQNKAVQDQADRLLDMLEKKL